ncbi:MarR family winged helix-turn-helix transcriptional regulator [Nafulsella turpanensis]|uniref:MarR family winged helix-turn-helix transcriptional regulator n=1 Tax=Nafulsella turpanensis TaxID=1265690 RepID=UPI00034CB601|nr:MarR family transcriptional regulator [Nafulsella turpanensis]
MEEPYSLYSLLLDRTARSVKQFAQRQFKELGFNVTVDQWLVLRQLYEHNGLNQRELAERVFKDTPTLTRIIDLLCSKGLTERVLHPEDRRSFIVQLTPDGVKKVEQLKPQIRAIRLKAWNGLGEEDFREFKRILSTINENLSSI